VALDDSGALFFLSLPDVETAIARVAERVRQGGHDVPEAVVRRRFSAGWKNFQQRYKQAADDWALYDNVDSAPIMLEWSENQ
jgi:predicted ABC-type ATPase